MEPGTGSTSLSQQFFFRISKTVMFCDEIAKCLGKQLSVKPISRDHTDQELEEDKRHIIRQLFTESKVFAHTPGRQHASFAEPKDIFSDVKVRALHKWLQEKKHEYALLKWAF